VNTPETSHQESRRHRALGDATRRSLLEALGRTTEPLDARTLANLVGLHVNTVRWHLDILVEAGIVAREATEAAGRGRPPYGYRLSAGTLIDGPQGVSFLTQVLADVVARTDPEVGSTVEQAGRVRGRALIRPRLGAKGADTEEAVGVVVQLLERLGFEPRVQRVRRGRRIAMRPCPFGELAAEHPSVVCRAHLGLMRGVLDTLRSPIEATALEPFVKPNLCLVHLELPPDASAGKPRGGDRSLASSITSGDR
jgi:predicted ArsR family transcriptional regulator